MTSELSRLLDAYRSRRLHRGDFLSQLVAATGSYTLAHQDTNLIASTPRRPKTPGRRR